MSRGLAYWNDETIKLIRERFIAVAVPTWVARAEGPEGEFLRSAGIQNHWITSSGYMNCVSASGRYLGRRPSEEVLAEFEKLPAAERSPGAVKVPALNPKERSIPSPPEGGLVLKVHARFLTKGEDGNLRHAITTDFPLMREEPKVLESWKKFLQPNTEYMWLTAEEKASLVPDEPKAGQHFAVDPAIAMRMARFHLTPKRATTSEGGIVNSKSVETAELKILITNVTPEIITMELDGKIQWGSTFDAEKATTPNGPLAMGFATGLEGRISYDRKSGEFTLFDIVAPGHIWGRWGDANNNSMYVERPGMAPFGFALELATGDSPTERIPPGGNGRYVEERGYFAESK